MRFFVNLAVKLVRKLGYPRQFFFELVCFPRFIVNILRYLSGTKATPFKVTFKDLSYSTADSRSSAGHVDSHYFLQDVWAARAINAIKPSDHVDIGSRLDGFVSHLLSSNQKIIYLDWREPLLKDNYFVFKQADIMNLPFPDNSVKSLSCLHVLEHIGLGRYGDPVDVSGHEKAAKELSRVLAPGGTLLVSVPIGKEALWFDAHRVFYPRTILSLFSELVLNEFLFIDPDKMDIQKTDDLSALNDKAYFCGLFSFTKASGGNV